MAKVKYAGFWLRFVAAVIDWFVIGVPLWLLMMGTMMPLMYGSAFDPFGPVRFSAMFSLMSFFGIFWIAAYWLYEAILESSAWQATVGKRAVSIIVTDMRGRRISFARASGRHFAKYISWAILLIGFIMAGLTEKKQALHDVIADTLVVRSSR